MMDPRTKQKHLRAVRLLVHLLEGHRSSLPAGVSLADVLADGLAAAQRLGMEIVTREAMAKGAAESSARAKVMAANPCPAPVPTPSARIWPFRAPVLGRGIEALYTGPAMPPPSCGIERSCPRGDA